jgi:Mn2+/Fe2+ NRAMP family transporter
MLIKILNSFRDKLGPGLMFGAVAVGISHLVQSTRAGADYGLTLGLLIIAVSMVKYPAFRFGARYAAATGKSLLDNYRRQGRPVTLTFVMAVSVDAFIGTSAVTLVTAGLFKNIFNIGLNDVFMTCLLLAGGALLLISGRYRLLEKTTKVFVIGFAVLTVIASILAFTSMDIGSAKLAAPVIFDRSGILFMIAVAGVMPTAVSVSVFHSEWIVAKAKMIGHRVTPAEADFDFNVGYLGTIFLALCFLFMGTALMFNTDIILAPGATGFAAQLIDMFATVLGNWARLIIAIAALAVMLSSVLALLDGCPRTVARIIQEWRSPEDYANDGQFDRLYTILLITQVVGGSLILTLFMRSFTGFIDFSTSVAFLAAPFLAWFNHRAMLADEVPEDVRPGTAMRIWSVTGIIVLAASACAYVYLGILT